ncbi:MAG TPA: hypothetical protein VGB65_03090, partial [Allosphingosinicella sp.]
MTTYNLYELGDAGTRIVGSQSYDQIGRDVSSAGDVNGDGFEDFIFQRAYSQQGYAKGGAYLIFGKAEGLGSVNLAALSPGQGVFLQGGPDTTIIERVTSAGDVNGDGFDDILLGDARYPNQEFDGRAILVYGKASWGTVFDLSTMT